MRNYTNKINKTDLIKSVFLTVTFFGFFLASCGPSGVKSPKRSGEGSAVATTAGQSLLEMDPEKMTDSELQNFISQLQSRDFAETDEYFFLQQMNKELCDRLQRQRSECVASVRLIPDGSEKILGCDGSYSENSNINHKFEVNVSSGGPYEVVANKNIKTESFETGVTAVTFKTEADSTIRAPRFMDLTSLRLRSTAGLPAIGNVGFEFAVNEEVLFTNDNLVASDDGDGTYYRIDPAHLFEIKKTSACRVELDEIQEIRQSILDRAAKRGATTPAANTQPAE